MFPPRQVHHPEYGTVLPVIVFHDLVLLRSELLLFDGIPCSSLGVKRNVVFIVMVLAKQTVVLYKETRSGVCSCRPIYHREVFHRHQLARAYIYEKFYPVFRKT